MTAVKLLSRANANCRHIQTRSPVMKKKGCIPTTTDAGRSERAPASGVRIVPTVEIIEIHGSNQSGRDIIVAPVTVLSLPAENSHGEPLGARKPT